MQKLTLLVVTLLLFFYSQNAIGQTTLDLSKLEADPLAKAQANASNKAITISGYIYSTDNNTISICESQVSQLRIVFPRSSIIAAFKDDDKARKTTFLINGDAIISAQAKDLFGKKEYECADTGVAEARPLGSIHPQLAKLQALKLKIKKMMGQGPGSKELSCGGKHYECTLNPKTTIGECDNDLTACLIFDAFDFGYKPNLF